MDKYFDKAVLKEGMEEKMLATTSVQIKAITCTICNYTSYKASELCRWDSFDFKNFFSAPFQGEGAQGESDQCQETIFQMC